MTMTKNKTPTASDIKYLIESAREDSLFFSRNNMKFAGDTMRNFGTYRDADGTIYLYRKKPVKHGIRGSWIFDPVALTLTKVQR